MWPPANNRTKEHNLPPPLFFIHKNHAQLLWSSYKIIPNFSFFYFPLHISLNHFHCAYYTCRVIILTISSLQLYVKTINHSHRTTADAQTHSPFLSLHLLLVVIDQTWKKIIYAYLSCKSRFSRVGFVVSFFTVRM